MFIYSFTSVIHLFHAEHIQMDIEWWEWSTSNCNKCRYLASAFYYKIFPLLCKLHSWSLVLTSCIKEFHFFATHSWRFAILHAFRSSLTSWGCPLMGVRNKYPLWLNGQVQSSYPTKIIITVCRSKNKHEINLNEINTMLNLLYVFLLKLLYACYHRCWMKHYAWSVLHA